MHVLGLTGGIGCGKSTVAQLLASRRVPVVDADEVARDVVLPGTEGLAAVTDAFGAGVLASDGTLDRKALGAIVFADIERRRALNAILHPRIGMESAARFERLAGEGHGFAVYEAALLVENGTHAMFEALIVVTARPDVQRDRVMARDGFTLADAEARVRAQLPMARKVAMASHVVDNSGTLERLAARVGDLYALLVTTYGDPRGARGTR